MTIKHNKALVGGLNPTRTFLLRSVRISTGVDIYKSGHKVFQLYDRWVINEGKRSALLRAKAISHCALNYYMDQENPCYPFLKTTDGFPTVILELKSFKGDAPKMQAALSLLHHWRNILAPGTPDVSSITDDATVEPHSTIAEMLPNIPISWKFDNTKLHPGSHELRSKMGPNGQALLYSTIDYLACEAEGLLPKLYTYCNLSNSKGLASELLKLQQMWEIDEPITSITTGRLSVKQELGGKDRLFAICDYWTQISLHPLHDKLASILKSLQCDGTFGQDSAALQVQEWTKSNLDLYSLDLKSATDRFPVKAITAMLVNLTSKSFGEAWEDLIAKRKFSFLKRKLEFRVGQPLGAYSSWPSFALAHHLVVLTAAKKAGIENPQYRLLGDDIVLVGERLRDHYITIMTRLGVTFSLSKSLQGVNRAEFAKRIFYKGREITPVPIKLVSKAITDYRLSLTLFLTLIKKTTWRPECYSAVPIFLKSLRGFHSPNTLKKIWKIIYVHLLVTFPDNTPNLSGSVSKGRNLFPNISSNEINRIYNLVRLKVIRDNFQKEFNKLTATVSRLRSMELPGTDYGGRLHHPIFNSISILQESQIKVDADFQRYFRNVAMSEDRIRPPNLHASDIEIFQSSYQKKQIREALIALRVYNTLDELNTLRSNDPKGINLHNFLSYKDIMPL